MLPAKGNGSKESGEAEKIDTCASKMIDPVDDKERFQFDEGSSHCGEENSSPALKLRGGGGTANGRKSSRLADDARVPASVWFFAGKMGPPQTGKELRDRRAKEEAYVKRMQAEREARKAQRKKKAGAKIKGGGEGKKKGSGGGGFWKKMFGKKKKSTKTRGEAEMKSQQSMAGYSEEEDYDDDD